MTSERTCHFTGDDAWKCGTHCTCQHFNWNNKGQTAMTSECKHRSYQTVPMNGRKCNDCGRWLDDEETAMTSELRPAVEVWDDAIAAWAADTIDTRQAAAAVIEADREAVRAEQAAEVERLREALEAYAARCTICSGGGSIAEEDSITGAYLWRDCPGCTPARAALAGDSHDQ